ncbi:hypothetical protein ACA910_000079 [Epithemia clementina (nom. ined.)]
MMVSSRSSSYSTCSAAASLLFLTQVLPLWSSTTLAFAPITTFTSSRSSSTSTTRLARLQAVLDPSVATRKEYQDVCGIGFDDRTLEERLQATEFLHPQHVAVIRELEPVAQEMVDHVLLETGEKAWQPQDFLPDLTKEEGWQDEVQNLRKMAQGLSDELFVVLIGDMVTEEALPTYQTLLNTFEGCDDPTGTSPSAWAQWSRGWTSEENRHGDLLNKYLYLSGKCDMRNVEVTIQHLISNGFNPLAQKDPYRGFVYTSFQERATKISHGRVGQLARTQGDTNLSRMCAIIAGDEGRHEKAYQRFCSEIIQLDPNGFLIEMADVLRGQITMPAEQMSDGTNRPLYQDFANVAQRLGVYTALDYADIVQHLVQKWDLTNLQDLSSEAEKEREYICRLPERYRKLAERSMNKQAKLSKQELKQPFNWIFGRLA